MKNSYQKALAYALLLFKYRQRSVYELRDRLKRKGYSREDEDSVVSFLSAQGYLDDEQFARSFARAKLRRAFGPRRIVFELRKLGIGDDDARAAVNDAAGEVQGTVLLKEIAARTLEKKGDREKTIRYLLQRGFSYTEIREVLDENR